MASFLPEHFVTKFDTVVRQDYGYIGQLNFDMFYVKDAQSADGSYFNKQGLFYSHKYIPNSATMIGSVEKSRIKIMLDWYATEYFIDQVEQRMLNYQDEQYAIQGVKEAIGRRKDATILEAITSTTTTNVVPKNVSGANAGLTLESLMATSNLLNKNHVPKKDRVLICSSDQLSNLMKNTKVTSSDFNTVKALVSGEIDTFYGFKFITIDPFEAAKGVSAGIPIDTVAAETFAYAFASKDMKCPIGVVYNTDMIINVDQQASNFNFGTVIQAKMGLGAGIIDEKGIVKVVCNSVV